MTAKENDEKASFDPGGINTNGVEANDCRQSDKHAEYSTNALSNSSETSKEPQPPPAAKSLADLRTLRRLPESVSRWPLLFERSSASWWNPRFDSSILEEQYWKSTFPGTTRRFQYGLIHLLMLLAAMAVYFPAMRTPLWSYMLGLSVAVFAVVLGVLAFTLTSLYKRHCYKVSILTSLAFCSFSLLAIATFGMTEEGEQRDLTPAGMFAIYLDLMLLLYAVVSLPLYAALLIGIAYSVLFETLLVLAVPERIENPSTAALNVLIHVCIHFIGVHILITTQVRMRDTFMKVGQSLMVKKQLVTEKGLKEKMILSVMPPKVADWLMKEGPGGDEDDNNQGNALGSSNSKGGSKRRNRSLSDSDDDDGDSDGSDESTFMMRKVSSPRSSNQGDIRSIFRPFNMNTMDDVSILFADIVGFTKMSSNKTASQLVGLLNDLFGRFDYLCTLCGCEKISTLGDCYYCVSGCPEPVPDHAKNCVEMGLAMISAIKQFDEDRHESVNMRVGIHTGTVLCGIVGKRRFKFDVWSNDVNLANAMESTGKPGKVHISEKTYAFLKDQYFVLEGDPVEEMKTYFISGRAIVEENAGSNGDSNPFRGQDGILTEYSPPQQPSDALNYSKSKSPNNAAVKGANASSVGAAVEGNAKSLLVRAKSGLKAVSSKQRITQATVSAPDSGENELQTQLDVSKSLFSLATKTCAKLDTRTPEVKVDPGKEEKGSVKPKLQTEISLPAGANYNTILNRRCSHSLPSLQSSREFSAILGVGCELSALTAGVDAQLTTTERGDTSEDAMVGSPTRSQLATLRVQSDHAMIRCVKDDESHQKIFTRPPLHRATLFFRTSTVEQEYRRTGWRPRNEYHHQRHPGSYGARKLWPPSIFTAYFDLLISCLTFGIVSLALFLHYPITWPWMLYFTLAFTFHAVVVIVYMVHLSSQKRKAFRRRTFLSHFYVWARGWFPSHCFGLLLTSLPMLSVFAAFQCDEVSSEGERDFFLQLVYIGLVHFSNLSALNYFAKGVAATICALVAALLCSPITCGESIGFQLSAGGSLRSHLFVEAVLSIFMLLTLVWMLNREFEIAYRISFHCTLQSAQDRRKIQNLKNQADWLLHNIIPKHISESLKRSSGYSENHKEVGIIFAKLVNFNELYDESYMGGREFLRVLNELISDVDELLDRKDLRNVEKIKTIGATFMAASGMNPYIRQENTHKYQHIRELMEFVFELQRTIMDFNQSLIEFDLQLRVGFNFGDVTAGVIGTTKLYYDIWGDAVNIASRMESTGVVGRVQVNEKCMHVLSDWYTFELRGSIFVKGKDNMTTYLLVGKKPDAVVSAVC